MIAILADLVRRTRQHHAIEHATLHMLAGRFPQQRFSALSDPLGFVIYGEVNEYDLRRAVGDALLRLQAGESALAIHPNCGTNLATTGVLATLVAILMSGGKRSLVDRFIVTLLWMLPALVLARPLGYRLQEYTTLANVADRWVADVQPVALGRIKAQRVLFE
jgi:hypothetical protein